MKRKPFLLSLLCHVSGRGRQWRVGLLLGILSGVAGDAAASVCTSFGEARPLGMVNISALKEASGLGIGGRQPGVFWTHNDGKQGKVYALNYQGELLVRYDVGVEVEDVEDMAVGPGPQAGVSYLYLADTGGAATVEGVRNQVQVLRIPEPLVDVQVPAAVPSVDLAGVEAFYLTYPDGSYDAETLMVDPLTGDLYVVTKQNRSCRLYRTNLNGAAPGSVLMLQFLSTVTFQQPSGGDISPDGSQVVLRWEDEAMIWNRSGSESLDLTLGRAGVSVPVIGTPEEPNGEAVGFLPGGGGYLTLSEGENPVVYFFPAQCDHAPAVLQVPADQTGIINGTVVISAEFTGLPLPEFVWRKGDTVLAGATGATLTLTDLQAGDAGVYEVTAVNSLGSATAQVEVRVKQSLDLRLTELQAQPASGNANSADWWELTNFEPEPVSLAGWRFNDDSGGLATAYILPADLSIAPGESIIFVEALSPLQFRSWWGEENVPESIRIVTYTGAGLAFSANGDGFRLWPASAVEGEEPAISVDFGTATAGVTFSYDPAAGQFGGLAQLGVNGVISAAGATDIGSPGRYRAAAVIPEVTLERVPGGTLRLGFTTVAGQRYVLEETGDPGSGEWLPEGGDFTATDSSGGSFEIPADSPPRQFYRIRVE